MLQSSTEPTGTIDNSQHPQPFMKILILAPQPYYRDWRVCIYLDTLLRALAAEGHHPTCLVYPGGEIPTIAGCRFLHVPRRLFPGKAGAKADWREPFFARTMARMAKRLLAIEDFDLLLAFDGAVLTTRSLSRRHHLPYLLYISTPMAERLSDGTSLLSPFKPICRWLEQRAVNSSIGVLTARNSPADRKGIFHSTSAACTVDNASLLGRAGMVPRSNTEAALGKPRGAMTLMYVGELGPEHGTDLLINSFSLAYIDRIKLRLAIVGGSRRQIAGYRRKARDLGVARAIHFAGNRPFAQLGAYLAQADILISPALDGEEPPLELASLLDSGRPVIASRTKAHAETLDSDVALLVDPVDSEMAVAITRLAENEQLRITLADRAKARAIERYSMDAYRRRLRTFLQQLRQRLPSGAKR